MIKPYYPPWSEHRGNQIISTSDEPIQSGSATGIQTKVRYKDKKGKIQECVKWVKWDQP